MSNCGVEIMHMISSFLPIPLILGLYYRITSIWLFCILSCIENLGSFTAEHRSDGHHAAADQTRGCERYYERTLSGNDEGLLYNQPFCYR